MTRQQLVLVLWLVDWYLVLLVFVLWLRERARTRTQCDFCDTHLTDSERPVGLCDSCQFATTLEHP